jgi:RimJ/RimL family protein N-acetyltransferase
MDRDTVSPAATATDESAAGAHTAPRDLTGIGLTTGRLVLTPPGQADIDALTAICQDPQIPAWTTVPSPYTRADAERFVLETVPNGLAAGTDAVFALYHATTGQVLGMVGLHRIEPRGATRTARAELGYWTAAEARGHGYMTEAARAVCRWGFADLGLERIDWMAFVPNHASRRVAEKLGFTLEGTYRRRHIHKGRVVDTWFGGLLPGELR